jgi:hypothetical protein
MWSTENTKRENSWRRKCLFRRISVDGMYTEYFDVKMLAVISERVDYG